MAKRRTVKKKPAATPAESDAPMDDPPAEDVADDAVPIDMDRLCRKLTSAGTGLPKIAKIRAYLVAGTEAEMTESLLGAGLTPSTITKVFEALK